MEWRRVSRRRFRQYLPELVYGANDGLITIVAGIGLLYSTSRRRPSSSSSSRRRSSTTHPGNHSMLRDLGTARGSPSRPASMPFLLSLHE